jgi:hypothetical protein
MIRNSYIVLGDLLEIAHLQDRGGNRTIILTWILRRCGVRIAGGWDWFSILYIGEF